MVGPVCSTFGVTSMRCQLKDQATDKYEASKNGRRPARSSEAEIPDLRIRIGLRSVSALVDLHSYEAPKL